MKTTVSNTPEIEAKFAAKRAGRLATTPDRFKGHFVASWSSNCSPRRAVKAFCLECNGFDPDAITGCTAYACPLWKFRPFKRPMVTLAKDASAGTPSKDVA
jgi:hypothetical protein